MYWSTSVEKDCLMKRCVLWPEGGLEHWNGDITTLQTYILTKLTFGDKISSSACNLSKEICLEMFLQDPDLQQDVIENSYVDDLQVTDLEHGKEDELREKTKLVDQALEKASMFVKKWVYSGALGEDKKPLPEQKQLGFIWRPTEDVIRIKSTFNFSKSLFL